MSSHYSNLDLDSPKPPLFTVFQSAILETQKSQTQKQVWGQRVLLVVGKHTQVKLSGKNGYPAGKKWLPGEKNGYPVEKSCYFLLFYNTSMRKLIKITILEKY